MNATPTNGSQSEAAVPQGGSAIVSFSKAVKDVMQRMSPDFDQRASEVFHDALLAVESPIRASAQHHEDQADHAANTPAEVCQLLQGEPNPLLAFYLPPWEAFLIEDNGQQDHRTVEVWLARWHSYHRNLLDAKALAPELVTLVNAGRLDATGLAMTMKTALPSCPGLDDVAARAVLARLPSAEPALSRWLSARMAQSAPQYWELYESLESCALLCGREPEFRATSALPPLDEAVSGMLLAAEIQAGHGEAGRDKSRPDQMALIEELQRENELLCLQVQQLHEELCDHMLVGQQLRSLVVEAGDAADTARRLLSSLTTDRRANAPST